MGIIDFMDMTTAIADYDEEQIDFAFTVRAWQTALLMNATGNFKKKIKSTDLYESPVRQEGKSKKANKQYVESEVNKLHQLFDI